MGIPIVTRRVLLGGGGRLFKAVEFNGASTQAVVTDDVNIQDLQDAAFTADAYIRADSYGEANVGRIFDKTGAASEGWYLSMSSSNGLAADVYTAGTDGSSRSTLGDFTADGRWHLVSLQFDDAGDRKIYFWVDGIPTSYNTQTAAVDAIVTDVGNDFYTGARPGWLRFDGAIGGWARLSNVGRYTNGVAFTPPPVHKPPAVDGNTAWQTNFEAGTGTTLTDVSGNGNDGTLSNHKWVILSA